MSEDKRIAVRIAKALDVVYSCDSPPIKARVEDLSETGMFVETSHPLEIGAVITFSLNLPDADESRIEGKATVVWTDHSVGAGVHFSEISGADQERIKWFVAETFFGGTGS